MAMQPRTRYRMVATSSPDHFPRYALLPLRLFMAVTFFYAGIQKLTDPGYFAPSAPTYIGSQISAFASGSPIGFLFQWFAVPYPTQVGWIVIAVELGIGVLTFIGLFTRLAAGIGAALSLTLFLSATWDVQPYFLGSDSIYAVAWITLAIAGDGGVFSLQSLLSGGRRLYGDFRSSYGETDHERRRSLLQIGGAAVALVWLLGMLPRAQASADNSPLSSTVAPGTPTDPSGSPTAGTGASTDAAFVLPTAAATTTDPSAAGASVTPSVALSVPTGGAPVVATTTSASSDSSLSTGSAAAASPTAKPAASPTSRPKPTATRPPPTPTTAPPVGTVVGTMSQLQQNGGAITFADPQSGDPAVVINLGANKLVAYSTVCTHAGCTVRYYAAAQRLVCPCHGAMFDPAQGGQPVRGPARRPLTELQVKVGSDGKIYAVT